MTRKDIFEYVREKYGTDPDYPWASNPGYAALRHSVSRKWYGLVMDIPKSRLGINDDSIADVINLKCDTLMMGSTVDGRTIFPAYHMNRKYWISVLIEEAEENELRRLIDMSYSLTSKK